MRYKCIVLSLVALLAVACSQEHSRTTPLTGPTLAGSGGGYRPHSLGADPFVASGPSGCVDVSTVAPVARWVIENVPKDAKVDKAYLFDGGTLCKVVDNLLFLRTQNNHLRYSWVNDTTLQVEYDTSTFQCRGRAQVDVSVNGRLLIGVIIVNSNAPICLPPTEPPSPPPPPTCATDITLCEVPPPPSCLTDQSLCPPPPPTCETNPELCIPPPPPPPPDDDDGHCNQGGGNGGEGCDPGADPDPANDDEDDDDEGPGNNGGPN